MADDEPYEIMPYKEMANLKKSIEDLKKTRSDDHGELVQAISRLTDTMNSMLSIFKTAAEEMKIEDGESNSIRTQMEPFVNKLDTLIDQNKTIAEGLIAVADMVNKDKWPTPSIQDTYNRRTVVSEREAETEMPEDMNAPQVDDSMQYGHNFNEAPQMPSSGGPQFGPQPPFAQVQRANYGEIPTFPGPRASPPPGPMPGAPGFPPFPPNPMSEEKKGMFGKFKR
jgi:hypothetical protein